MSDQIQLSGPQLTVGQPDPVFPVSHRAWQRLRSRVESLEHPIPWAQNAQWTCFGIAPSAFLAWFAWLPAYSQLPSSAQLTYAWISPTMLIVGIAALAFAILCIIMNRSVHGQMGREVKHLVEDMDELHAPHQQQTSSLLPAHSTTVAETEVSNMPGEATGNSIQLDLRRQTETLRLLVTNLGSTGEFEVQVVDVRVSEAASDVPWTVPWDTGEARTRLLPQQARLLDLVRFDQSAAQSMWNGHATGGPFVFPDAAGTLRDMYCDSLIASSSAEMKAVRVCVRVVIFRDDPPDRLEATVRFGFFEGDDTIDFDLDVCAPLGEDAIRMARTLRIARMAAIAQRVRTELVEPRFRRLPLRHREEEQIVEFLLQVGLGHIRPETRLAVGSVRLEDGSTEERLRPEHLFHASAAEVSIDVAADGTDETLRLIQNTLQDDLMPTIRSLEWQQWLAEAIAS